MRGAMQSRREEANGAECIWPEGELSHFGERFASLVMAVRGEEELAVCSP